MHAGKCSPAFSPVHDALQDGGEGRDADASPNQDGVLRGEDLPGGRPVWPVHVALSSKGGEESSHVRLRGQRSEGAETIEKLKKILNFHFIQQCLFHNLF